MEELMNIYQMQKKWDHRAEKNDLRVGISRLKKVSGGEDIVTLSAEAINSYRKDNVVKIREQELIKLALRHVNDSSPEIEDIGNDREFIKAERLALMAELVIRVVPSGNTGNIYGRVTEFVTKQLTDR